MCAAVAVVLGLGELPVCAAVPVVLDLGVLPVCAALPVVLGGELSVCAAVPVVVGLGVLPVCALGMSAFVEVTATEEEDMEGEGPEVDTSGGLATGAGLTLVVSGCF